MKRILMGVLIVTAAACRPEAEKTAEKYDLSTTGIEWHEGLDSVVDRGKPILFFQLLGDFDHVYC